jgi:hypothetical protein
VAGRDSETAAVVEDKKPLASMMNGQNFTAAEFAAKLRRRMWSEHLGLTSADESVIDDPLDPKTLRFWTEVKFLENSRDVYRENPILPELNDDAMQRSNLNTKIFEKVIYEFSTVMTTRFKIQNLSGLPTYSLQPYHDFC